MKLGVNSVLFSGYDLQTAIEYIKFSGYDGLELSSIVGMVEHLTDTAGDHELNEIRKVVDEAGLELYCVEAATNILVPENRERTKRVFERAAKLGIPMVTTGSAGKSDDEETTEASIRAIEELAQAASDVGIRYALKLHYGQSIYNTKTALRLMDEVKHPGLGLNFDATHVGRVGDNPVEAIGALHKYIIHTHIRDTFIEQLKIAAPEFQTAGRGTVPLKAVVDKMIETGYEGATVLEIIGAKDYKLPEVVAIAAESRGYLSRLFEEAKEKREELQI
ncbi:sugar phosphate isomerase/epimerase family protein [Aquibacillus salsiterrae]|uniref:Sugar phosphate isomerase/epimerase n=1 Tax=Aquibacillus salsiterrae TaxID=2950439 RepID=A0A9X4ADV3_9BACI|nr:sugar phosphate isomerase/epimerase [Aquibacillus salsiterrae]MDC3415916.1 sugar phosphate isomerase/epimerase [Aquibacillus salsiterrae]